MEENKYIRINSKFKYFVFICLYYLLYPICHILYGGKNNWLICETGDTAQDNGYVFYRYLKENHPDIKPFYLIKKSSPDYQKVISLGKVVEFGSFKHFLLMIGSSVKVSDHLFGYSPWIQSTLYYRRNKTRHKHIFLQHGITKNDIPGFYYDVCKSLNIFVCGAKPEYEYLRNNFGYSEGIVQYTGFPRFDNLNDYKSNGHILFMPTWRRYLSDLSEDEFAKTPYYKEWDSLLNDKELLNYCKLHGIYIDFYLHYELQKHSHLFKRNEIITIINFGKVSVQQLLRDSSVLVTDFSSVFFDFAYMKKPMLFFQFDETDYNKGHYAKGYFDYRKGGFGDVHVFKNDIVKSLISISENGFKMDNLYLSRVNDFFTLDSFHNCDRVYQRIIDINK